MRQGERYKKSVCSLNFPWSLQILNFINVIVNLHITDVFLGNQFSNFGWETWRMMGVDDSERSDPLMRVFPKVRATRRLLEFELNPTREITRRYCFVWSSLGQECMSQMYLHGTREYCFESGRGKEVRGLWCPNGKRDFLALVFN